MSRRRDGPGTPMILILIIIVTIKYVIIIIYEGGEEDWWREEGCWCHQVSRIKLKLGSVQC